LGKDLLGKVGAVGKTILKGILEKGLTVWAGVNLLRMGVKLELL
jgi:hypothetical protein